MDLLWQPQMSKNHLRPRPVFNIDAKAEYLWKEGNGIWRDQKDVMYHELLNLIKQSQRISTENNIRLS